MSLTPSYRRQFIYIFALMGLSGTMAAQSSAADTSQSFRFTLDLDGYYRYASSRETSRSFLAMDHDQLSLGWLSGGVDYERNGAGVSARAAFGPRAFQYFNEGNGGVLDNVRYAFGYYQVAGWLRLNAGVMPTFYGYEFDDPIDNDQYSNSWAYTYSPASVTGVTAELDLGQGWTAMLGRFNGTFSRFNRNGRAVYGGYLNKTSERWWGQLSTLLGRTEADQRYRMLDLTVGYAVNQRLRVGGEITYHPFREPGPNQDWTRYWLFAQYLAFDLDDRSTFALRQEIVRDRGGFVLPPGMGVYSLTTALTRAVGPAKFFAELRLNNAVDPLFREGSQRVELAGTVGFAYRVGGE